MPEFSEKVVKDIIEKLNKVNKKYIDALEQQNEDLRKMLGNVEEERDELEKKLTKMEEDFKKLGEHNKTLPDYYGYKRQNPYKITIGPNSGNGTGGITWTDHTYSVSSDYVKEIQAIWDHQNEVRKFLDEDEEKENEEK